MDSIHHAFCEVAPRDAGLIRRQNHTHPGFVDLAYGRAGPRKDLIEGNVVHVADLFGNRSIPVQKNRPLTSVPCTHAFSSEESPKNP